MADQKKEERWIHRTGKYFIIAAMSGLTATTFVHPMDTIKVRCQIANEAYGAKGERHIINPLRIVRQMWGEAGIVAFYKGFDSSVFKQITYGATRFGVYRYLYETGVKEHGSVSYFNKLKYSMVAGVCASLIGNPSDMTMVRRQSDLALPPEQRRNYRNVFQAFYRIAKTEGFFTLWTGVQYSMLRVVTASMAQFSTFDEIKERTRKYRGVPDDIYNRIVAAMASGMACTLASLPFDNMKVKYQKMKKLPDGTFPYNSLLDVFVKTFKREGIFGFWTGVPAFFMYIGPHTLISLISQDYYHILFNKMVRH